MAVFENKDEYSTITRTITRRKLYGSDADEVCGSV